MSFPPKTFATKGASEIPANRQVVSAVHAVKLRAGVVPVWSREGRGHGLKEAPGRDPAQAPASPLRLERVCGRHRFRSAIIPAQSLHDLAATLRANAHETPSSSAPILGRMADHREPPGHAYEKELTAVVTTGGERWLAELRLALIGIILSVGIGAADIGLQVGGWVGALVAGVGSVIVLVGLLWRARPRWSPSKDPAR
jgi:hypothetical protein